MLIMKMKKYCLSHVYTKSVKFNYFKKKKKKKNILISSTIKIIIIMNNNHECIHYNKVNTIMNVYITINLNNVYIYNKINN